MYHSGKVFSQIHGLTDLYLYGVSKDLRTGLNLNPENPLTIKDELELSFSFMLNPDESMYFGYVFRFITDDINIDLIFNYDDNDNTSFTLVQGQKLLLKHKTDFRVLSSDWSTFHFIFDIKNSKISVNLSDTIINVGGSVLKRGDKARLFFWSL